jgi:flagellin
MRINNNLMAMNTHRQLGINSNAGAKSIEKLSSGYRINRAGDDAAGLAISEKMRGQIRGLNQASRNSQDGISLIQTAEGALNETQAILQRMRELAVQSANDTNVDADRTAIQNEVDQLVSEIDRIGDTTEFNTRKLLNGGASVGGTIAGTDAAKLAIAGGTGDTKAGNTVTLTGGVTAATKGSDTETNLTALTDTISAASDVTINGVSFSFGAGQTTQNVIDTLNNAGIGIEARFDSTANALVVETANVGSGASFTVDVAGTATLANIGAATNSGTDAVITASAGFTSYEAKGNTITVTDGNAKGLEFTVSGDITTFDNAITVDSNGTLSFQIGANENQEMNVGLNDMRASALGVQSIDISSAASAKVAITTVNDAITKVSDERAKLGAFQNRLEHTIKNLDTSAENLQASESRIRDVDMAKEMMNFTKNNILQQAAQSMLAQANQAPQGVLQLLR